MTTRVTRLTVELDVDVNDRQSPPSRQGIVDDRDRRVAVAVRQQLVHLSAKLVERHRPAPTTGPPTTVMSGP